MEFEWDENKAASNAQKHGVRFEDATNVFEDPFRLTEPARLVDGEIRYQTLGMAGPLLVLVVHTPRQRHGEQTARLISARPASRVERHRYEQGKAGSI